jgi:selenocysteine lyase/cysteine desulfurase
MKLIAPICLLALLSGSSASLAQEVPPEVVSRIKAKVAERYPDNYSMQKVLVDDQIEAPVHTWHGRLWTRVSAQVYNDRADIERLADAVLRRLESR